MASCLHRCTWYLIFYYSYFILYIFFVAVWRFALCIMIVYILLLLFTLFQVCVLVLTWTTLRKYENFDWMLVFKAHHWLCCVESHPNSASSKILILTTLSGYQIWFVSCAIEQNSKTTIIVLYWLCLKLELQWLSSPLKEGVTHLY